MWARGKAGAVRFKSQQNCDRIVSPIGVTWWKCNTRWAVWMRKTMKMKSFIPWRWDCWMLEQWLHLDPYPKKSGTGPKEISISGYRDAPETCLVQGDDRSDLQCTSHHLATRAFSFYQSSASMRRFGLPSHWSRVYNVELLFRSIPIKALETYYYYLVRTYQLSCIAGSASHQMDAHNSNICWN